MKKILSILVLMTVTMTAGAWDLTVVDADEIYGSVVFEVGGTAVTSADEGKTVTIKVTPNDGYVVKTIGAQAYTDWTSGRAASLDVRDGIALTKTKDNVYTFTMPRASVKVSVTLEIKIVTKAQEGSGTGGETKQVDNVKVNMEAIAEPTVTEGITYIPVAVTSIDVSQTETTTEKKDITVEIGSQTVGSNVFVVKKIAKGAFETPEGSNKTVTKVVLTGDEVIEIEEGAMKTTAKGLLNVESPLSLLDDYALMSPMKENFEAVKISAVAKAPNRYWTFSSGVDTKVPDGITVFGVYNVDGTIRIMEIEEANTNKLIKANNGVLIACTSGKGGAKYEFVANPGGQKSGTTPATTDAKSYEGNCMMPVIEGYHFDAADILILKNNEFHTIGSQDTQVPACKAVLSLSKFNAK